MPSSANLLVAFKAGNSEDWNWNLEVGLHDHVPNLDWTGPNSGTPWPPQPLVFRWMQPYYKQLGPTQFVRRDNVNFLLRVDQMLRLPFFIQSSPLAPQPLRSATFTQSLHARRLIGPPPAFASAEFPGSVPDSAQMPPRRRRRSVAGIDQDDLLDPDALADPDSNFYEINGVRVHHKVCSHEDSGDQSLDSAISDAEQNQVGLPIVLLHGFGSSVFSWNHIMRSLARIAGGKVLAFDRPAFGLTSRTIWSADDTKPLNPYSMAFSVMATLAFINQLGANKAVLVGHSSGCLVAVETYFEAPERVAALVLVAPAIFVPVFSRKGVKEYGAGEEWQEKKNSNGSNLPTNPFNRIWEGFLELCMRIAGFLMNMIMAIGGMVRSLYCKAVVAVLRSSVGVMLVRLIMDKFGILAVRNAWYDPSKVTDHIIQGYTKPLRSRGWEMALLEYTISMIMDSTSTSKVPVSERLSEISCPVLVVSGETDRLVPRWNTERVARAIPGAEFEVIKNSGHLPQEERPEEFVSVVERFLRRAFGRPNEQEQMFQAAV
uniref:AB hydrolase-1 domain-containing protein n=1 Tax=Leersia perrieri TaxID=77586 RepID=A0A0D9XWB4_9ORYZ